MKKQIAAVALALAMATGLTAVLSTSQPVVASAAEPKGDVVAVAAGAPQVSTLVAAIKAAGLVEALQGKGPFTVFAPTNDAFAKLPAGTVENLLKPENKEQLKSILLYHVHAGAGVLAKDVKTMKLSTLNGKELNIVVADGKVTVDGANVIATDIVTSNGVIHLIDTVVLPPK
jgi:uncharacterized surface protein with fasciclin (FAS1) repeats